MTAGLKKGLRPKKGLHSIFQFAALAMLLAQGCGPSGKTAGKGYNVVILTIDTVRADHVGCYGYYRDTTPNIDAFSKQAVLFRRAIAQAPTTTPSMASFITSRYPHKHSIKIYGELNGVLVSLGRESTPLGRILKREGYRTAFISDNPTIFYIKGLRKGFDSFSQRGPNDFSAVTKAALDWIRRNKNASFLLWVHYLGAHPPYHPNRTSSLKVPLIRKDFSLPFSRQATNAWDAISKSAQEEGHHNLNYYVDNYDGKIRLSDEHVGAILRELERLGLDKNTLVVIAADHGEEFGEHRLYCEHGRSLHDTLVAVPLLIRFPGGDWGPRAVESAVGLIDVVPTILEALGLEKASAGFDGESLLPLMKGASNSGFVFSEAVGQISVTSAGWKLIARDMQWALGMLHSYDYHRALPLAEYAFFDLEKDKGEQHALSGTNIGARKPLEEALASFRAGRKQFICDVVLPAAKEPADEEFRGAPDDSAKRLKNLGYMQ